MTQERPAPGRTARDRRTVLRTLAGGTALTALLASALAAAEPAPAEDAREGRLREYWIQAESFWHNAVPNGCDAMTGTTYKADQTSFQAVGYRAYSPGWGSPLPADHGPDGVGANSGIPGPVIRGQVGDTIRVHFRNHNSAYRWPHSMHPHGVRYDPANDGGWLADDPRRPGTAVPFGGTYTYTWHCAPSSVGTWLYHDHSMPQTIADPADRSRAARSGAPEGMGGMGGGGGVMEIGAQLGLFGILAVTDPRTPPVDREFALFFHDLYQEDVPSGAQDLDLVNGGAFLDNTPTFTARVGDRVRWRIASLGQEFHVFHLHGHRWCGAGGRLGFVDSEILGPSTTLTVEYVEDNPGDWIYHCHVTEHMMGGMAGRYRVRR